MTVVREIDSYMHNLNKVFLEENKNFHIPDFQRDFVWTDEEANELFKDFSEDSNNFETETSQLQGYLLGNIVLIDSGSKSLVVDGQQRLTTLSLIFKALYETVKNKAFDITNSDQAAWLGRLGELNKGFIRVDDAGEFIGLRITHEPTLPFGGYYKDLIRDTPNLEAKTISDENIESVYSSVLENIESLNDIQLNRFITYLRTKVKLIVTTAPSQSKAFQLFEVLNDRGRSLEPLDLVKNLFLKQLTTDGYNTEDLTQFNSNWTNFIKNLEISPKRKIASSTFMKHFVTAEYAKNIKQNTLFEFFDNKGDERSRIQSNEILNFSRKLVKTSEIYRDIEKNRSENKYSSDQNMFLLFKLLGVKQFHPILINFYDSNQTIKDKVLDACVRYAASVLFSYTQTNTIEKEIPNLIKAIKIPNLTDDEKANIIIKQMNILIEEQCTTLEKLIPTKSFSNLQGKTQKKALDLLKFIELYFNNNTSIIKVPSRKKITIEHIMPQISNDSPSTYGFLSLQEQKAFLNNIGNLTLLYSDENTAAGNKKFNDKIAIYKQTEFYITKTIVSDVKTGIKNGVTTSRVNLMNEYQPSYIKNNRAFWDKTAIDNRGKNIAKLLADLLTEKI